MRISEIIDQLARLELDLQGLAIDDADPVRIRQASGLLRQARQRLGESGPATPASTRQGAESGAGIRREGWTPECGCTGDISSLDNVGSALRGAQERLELAQRAAGAGIWDWDIVTGAIEWSPELFRLFGLDPLKDRAGFERWESIIHPEDLEAASIRLDRAVRDGSALDSVYRIVCQDGEVRWINSIGSTICDPGGRPLRMLGFCIDISDRKRTEEKLVERQRQLEELNRTLEKRVAEETRKNREMDYLLIQQSRQAEMGEMINIIAHQWRQPLNVIGLYAQVLAESSKHGDLDESGLENTVRQIMDILAHMSQTIDDFRNFLKPDREKTRFRVKEVVARTYDLISASFRAQDVRVEIAGDDDLCLTGYANEYAQVIMNILNNAKDALQDRDIEKPRIGIMVAREGTRTVVTISDNAGGIEDDLQKRIFEPYFTTKKSRMGSGIGLYLSRNIIENSMHGCLTVRNTGAGAEFRIEV